MVVTIVLCRGGGGGGAGGGGVPPFESVNESQHVTPQIKTPEQYFPIVNVNSFLDILQQKT